LLGRLYQSRAAKSKCYADGAPTAGYWRLHRALERAGAREIVDLCSGSGGPWLHLSAALEAEGYAVRVVLTDLYPNLKGFARMAALSGGRIGYRGESVGVARVPSEFGGFRTLFSGFHYFRPAQARAIRGDAVASRRGIAVFEAAQRRPSVLALMLVQPLAVWIVTPLVRPFRWSRLLWTYLLPVMPFVVLFDGIVSRLRTYSPDELRAGARCRRGRVPLGDRGGDDPPLAGRDHVSARVSG
jgi:hypothetical protein